MCVCERALAYVCSGTYYVLSVIDSLPSTDAPQCCHNSPVNPIVTDAKTYLHTQIQRQHLYSTYAQEPIVSWSIKINTILGHIFVYTYVYNNCVHVIGGTRL